MFFLPVFLPGPVLSLLCTHISPFPPPLIHHKSAPDLTLPSTATDTYTKHQAAQHVLLSLSNWRACLYKASST